MRKWFVAIVVIQVIATCSAVAFLVQREDANATSVQATLDSLATRLVGLDQDVGSLADTASSLADTVSSVDARTYSMERALGGWCLSRRRPGWQDVRGGRI